MLNKRNSKVLKALFTAIMGSIALGNCSTVWMMESKASVSNKQTNTLSIDQLATIFKTKIVIYTDHPYFPNVDFVSKEAAKYFYKFIKNDTTLSKLDLYTKWIVCNYSYLSDQVTNSGTYLEPNLYFEYKFECYFDGRPSILGDIYATKTKVELAQEIEKVIRNQFKIIADNKTDNNRIYAEYFSVLLADCILRETNYFIDKCKTDSIVNKLTKYNYQPGKKLTEYRLSDIEKVATVCQMT